MGDMRTWKKISEGRKRDCRWHEFRMEIDSVERTSFLFFLFIFLFLRRLLVHKQQIVDFPVRIYFPFLM